MIYVMVMPAQNVDSFVGLPADPVLAASPHDGRVLSFCGKECIERVRESGCES